jgi:HK97 family phage major capsid protein
MALRPETVRAYRSKDVPEHYDLTEAIGQKAVGSLYEARQKALGMKQLGLNETVGPQGGFLVGQDHSYDIMSRVYNVGDLLRLVNIVGLGPNSNGMTFLRDSETSRALGNRRGGVRHYWLAEGGTKHASYPQFERFEMQLNKLAVLVYSTDELLQDATALESYIMEVAPEEIRFAVEDSIIRGTGAGQPQGILGAPCLVTVAAEIGQAVDTVVSENVINMWSRRWAGVKDYVWLVNQDVTPQLIQMNLGAGVGGGALTYMPPGGLSGLPYGTLFGRPVIESEYADTVGDVGDIILMAPSQYKMIDKGGVQQASSIHVAFLTDETVFRFVYRVDGEPSWAAPLTPYLSALTQSPFVALAAR